MKQKSAQCAVIIVTHNSEIHIPKAMECLLAQTHQPKDIVIVDSGSHDPSYLEKYKRLKNVRLVLAKGDVGFCKGNNIGMEKVSHECKYVFFLNPDAFLTPNYMEEAIDFMELPQNATCGALTGSILGYDIHRDKPTGKYDTTGVFKKWYGQWYDRSQGTNYAPELHAATESIPAICGAVFFCRRKALDTVLIRGKEVFDNTFYMYKEDIDLSLRLRKQGWVLAYHPHLIAYHCRGWQRDRSKMPRLFKLCSARNELRIHLKEMSPIGILYSTLKYAAVKLLNY